MLAVLCALLGLFASAGSLQGSPIQYLGSSGAFSASASFELSGDTLKITLTNTSLADVLVPGDVLTGVLFNTSHSLIPISASANASSVIYQATANAGDGWGYGSNVNAHGMDSAISATGAIEGLGHSNFSDATDNLGGLNYGILSLGDDITTGNKGVTKKGPLFKNSIQFTLTAANEFALDQIGSHVVFQYGLSLDEMFFDGYIPQPLSETPAVPEPGSFLLLGTGLAALVIGSRCRKHLSKK